MPRSANERGFAHWKVSACYGIGQLIIGLWIWGFYDSGIVWMILSLFVFFTGFIVINNKVKEDCCL